MRLFMPPKGLYSRMEQEFCGKELPEVGVGMWKFPGTIGVDILNGEKNGEHLVGREVSPP